MTLIERARAYGKPSPHFPLPETAALMAELAGEVERLWAFEKEFNEVILPAWNATRDNLHENLRQTRGSLEAEKAKTDVAGMMRKWLEGYRMAVSQFQPIMFNLLRACDTLPPEPTEEGDHE